MTIEKCHFINLDVIIESKDNLSPLVDFFGEKVFPLCNQFVDDDRYRLVLNTRAYRLKHAPERYIHFFLQLFNTIPAPLQKLWNKRTLLSFDIGVQGSIVPPPYPFEAPRTYDIFFESIKPLTLAKIAKLKGNLDITVYPYIPDA